MATVVATEKLVKNSNSRPRWNEEKACVPWFSAVPTTPNPT
jgi:hypothetical protein